MSFQSYAQSLRTRFSLGKKSKYLVSGLIIFVCVVAVIGIGMSCSNASFSVVHASDADKQGTTDTTLASVGDTQESQDASSAATDSSSTTSCLYVHVGGAVYEPGVYELSEGARANDAIVAAGGFAEDAATDAINLARLLVDGEQIIVPTIEQYSSTESSVSSQDMSASGGGSNTSTSSLININTATVSELDTLPGIGQATAQKIIDDRNANGAFTTPEDLKRVSGIGDKKYEQLSGLICV